MFGAESVRDCDPASVWGGELASILPSASRGQAEEWVMAMQRRETEVLAAPVQHCLRCCLSSDNGVGSLPLL